MPCSSFFSHGGAVAGVFVAVGLVVATIAALIAFFICKRRRRRHIRHSISRPLPQPDNPFEDPRVTPPTQMRYADSDSSHRNLVGAGLGVERGQRNLLDEEFASAPVRSHPPSVRSSSDRLETTLAGVGAGGRSLGRPAYDGSLLLNIPSNGYATSSPNHQHRPSYGSGVVGLAITNDNVYEVSRPTARHVKHTSATPSAAPSTPSIYPATLPGGEEDVSTESASSEGPVTPSVTESPVLPLQKPARPPRRRPVAPLPPRNPLRDAEQANKLLMHTQLTSEDAKVMNQKPYDSPSPPASMTDSSYSPASEYPATPAGPFANFNSPASQYPATPAGPFADYNSPASQYPVTPASPFVDYNTYMSGIKPPAETKPKDNFYTRRKLVSPHVSFVY